MCSTALVIVGVVCRCFTFFFSFFHFKFVAACVARRRRLYQYMRRKIETVFPCCVFVFIIFTQHSFSLVYFQLPTGRSFHNCFFYSQFFLYISVFQILCGDTHNYVNKNIAKSVLFFLNDILIIQIHHTLKSD